MIRLVADRITLDAAAPDGTPRRTISGIAAPWNVDAIEMGGTSVRLAPGSLPTDGPAPKLFAHHDPKQVIGIVTDRVATEDGMLFSARIADTALGNDYLELVKMGAIDSVSVGVEVIDSHQDGSTTVVTAGDWQELSLVSQPAFRQAAITKVAAAADTSDTDTDSVASIPTDPDQEDTPEMTDTAPAVADTVPTAPIFATAARPEVLPTAAEYIAAMAAGGDRWLRAQAAVRAAAPDVITTDTPGLLPIPIVAPVYNNFIGRRPVVDAVGVRAMPGGGKVFIRPEVTTHTSMAVQAAENTALQTGTYVVTNNQVTKATYGGYVTISEQDIDWTDPAVVQLVLDDMARIYANKTDDVAADALVAGASVTRNFAAASIADPTAWLEWIYGAAQTILSSSNGNVPTTLFVDPRIWANLGQLEDGSGRPLFLNQSGNPMNSFGTLAPGSITGTAFGLNVVVDRNFAQDMLVIGDTSGFEIFEQQKGALSITNPDTISRTISWHGYFATLMIDQTKFVKVAWT